MLKYFAGSVLLVLLVAIYWFMSTGVSPRPESPIIRGVHYVGISVNDLEQAATLYQNAFNLTPVLSETLQNEEVLDSLVGRVGVHAKTRLMRSSNGQLRLMEFQGVPETIKNTPRQEVKGPGFAHVCLQVNQNTKAYNKFLAGGAEPFGSPEMLQLNSRNPVYYAYARDKNDTIFEVEHVDVEALQLDKPPKNDYRMRHIALASPDIDRSVEFYSILLEQEHPRRLGRLLPLSGDKVDGVSGLPDAKLKMAFFQMRNMELEIAEYLSHPTEKPSTGRPLEANGYNMIVFEVDNMQAAKALLLKAGASIVSESLSIDGGPIMFARDLDGNLLGFQVLPKESPLSAAQFVDNGI